MGNVNWLEVLSIIAGFLSPLMVIVLTSRAKIRESDHAAELEDRREQTKKQSERYDEIIASIGTLRTDIRNQIDQIRSDVDDIGNRMNDLQSYDRKVEKDLAVLENQNELSGKYVRELTALMMALAEGVRDGHLDGNITAAAVQFRQFEEQELSKLLTK